MIKVTAAVSVGCAALLGGEVLYAIYGFGPLDAFTNPSHAPVTLGDGPPLRLLVMGDSTAAGQGAPYADGIAMSSARYLARRHSVTLVNLGVSGTRFREMNRDQLPEALVFAPDIVLVCCGANDVTHFTPTRTVKSEVDTMIDAFAKLSKPPEIVMTGSPYMAATPRFAAPLSWVAAAGTGRVNCAVTRAALGRRVVIAPVVDTGRLFLADPSLFDSDRYHPTARGYATWMPILERAFDVALARMP